MRQKTFDFSEPQLARLEWLAQQRGLSKGELVRRALDQLLDAAGAPFEFDEPTPAQHRPAGGLELVSTSVQHVRGTSPAPVEHRPAGGSTYSGTGTAPAQHRQAGARGGTIGGGLLWDEETGKKPDPDPEESPQSSGKAKRQKPEAPPPDPPPEIDSPELRQALAEFAVYRREEYKTREPMTARAWTLLLGTLRRKAGRKYAPVAVQHAMSKQWKTWEPGYMSGTLAEAAEALGMQGVVARLEHTRPESEPAKPASHPLGGSGPDYRIGVEQYRCRVEDVLVKARKEVLGMDWYETILPRLNKNPTTHDELYALLVETLHLRRQREQEAKDEAERVQKQEAREVDRV